MTQADRSRHYRRAIADAALQAESATELSLALTCLEIAQDGGLLCREDVVALLAVFRARHTAFEGARRVRAFDEATRALRRCPRSLADRRRVSLPRARRLRPHGSARRLCMQDDTFKAVAEAIRTAPNHPELRAAIDRAIEITKARRVTKQQAIELSALMRQRTIELDAAAIYRLVLEHGVPDDSDKRRFESPN